MSRRPRPVHLRVSYSSVGRCFSACSRVVKAGYAVADSEKVTCRECLKKMAQDVEEELNPETLMSVASW